MNSLKRKLKFETSAHSDVYRDLIDATCSTGTYTFYEKYIHINLFVAYGVLVPVIMANALYKRTRTQLNTASHQYKTSFDTAIVEIHAVVS